MVGLAALTIALGVFLMARPAVWWRLNEPPQARAGTRPTSAYLRRTRLRGLAFLLGGAALLLVQYLKTL